MKGLVESYNNEQDYHNVLMEDGRKAKVDLFVNGDIRGETVDGLVGKTVEIEYFTPYIEIAYGVRVLSSEEVEK